MKRLSDTQRGEARTLSIRVDDETHTRLLDLADTSSYTSSNVVRAFVADGLDAIEGDQPSAMGVETEKLWRDIDRKKKRARAMRAVETGELDKFREQETRIQELEALVKKLAAGDGKPVAGRRKA